MAMTVTPTAITPDGLKSDVLGNMRLGLVTLTFGASDTYVTGGFLVIPANFGFPFRIVTVFDATTQVGGYSLVYVPSTSPVGQGQMVAFSAMGTQLANASAALQSDTVVLSAIGY